MVSEDGKRLLDAAIKYEGVIVVTRSIDVGEDIDAGDFSFNESTDQQEQSRRSAALDELERHGLVEDRSDNGVGACFYVTPQGYHLLKSDAS